MSFDYIQVGLFAIIILTFAFLMGCTETTPPETIKKAFADGAYSREIEISELNTKIIELQETNEYLRKQSETIKTNNADLQETYNNLFTDAVNCYWANYCLYFEEDCVESLKDGYVGWTAQEIHRANSDECDMMIRDWDKYYSHDTSVN